MTARGGEPIGVAVLGSTGTIGDNTLDVISRHPERFRAIALGIRCMRPSPVSTPRSQGR